MPGEWWPHRALRGCGALGPETAEPRPGIPRSTEGPGISTLSGTNLDPTSINACVVLDRLIEPTYKEGKPYAPVRNHLRWIVYPLASCLLGTR